MLYKGNSRNLHLCRNSPYFWNSKNRRPTDFWNSNSWNLFYKLKQSRFQVGSQKVRVLLCVHFSSFFFPFFPSFSPLYECNSKVYLGNVGFDVHCFLLSNGMDGLYYLSTLCRYYYQCNTNTTRSFRDMHCFSFCTIDYSSYFHVFKVFVASKCCILIIIIEFDCI